MRFIDLCAGIGGFHQVMHRLGHECVYAAEIDKEAVKVYKDNYGIDAQNDLFKVKEEEIPEFDILCAGFPCTTFSKAGNRKGFEEETGQIIFHIIRILRYHKPRYIVLENVKTLKTHDKGRTWKIIKKELEDIGYGIGDEPLLCSPEQIGIPQNRERVLVLAELGTNKGKTIVNDLPKRVYKNIYDSGILDTETSKEYDITEYERKVLSIWDEFIKGIGGSKLTHPVWVEVFTNEKDIPAEDYKKWRVNYVKRNRKMYAENKEFIDEWLKKHNNLEDFRPVDKRLEWQCKDDLDSVWDGVIQFRQSGVRIKRPESIQTLVAIVQTPIIGKHERKLTLNEARKLQSFPEDFKLHKKNNIAYKQLGNSINVDIVEYFARKLL